MRRTFTLQVHDVPTELPLLCPGCNAVAAGAASASWWTSRGVVPWCNECSTPPSGVPDEHLPPQHFNCRSSVAPIHEFGTPTKSARPFLPKANKA